MAGPREDLLQRAEALLVTRGRLSDLTLRSFAQQLGTSHRMLSYHFGSRDGLLAALLGHIWRREQQTLAAAASGGRAGAIDAMIAIYADPEQESRLRAFHYVLGLALQDPDTYRQFLDDLDGWTNLFTELGVREGLPPRTARSQAHLIVWAGRGMTVRFLATGDRDGALAEIAEIRRELGV